MKNKTNFRILLQSMAYMLFFVALFSVVGAYVPEISEMLALIGVNTDPGFVLGATVLATGADTYETARGSKPASADLPGHLKDDISKTVTLIRPDMAPIDTILRKINASEKAENIQVNFEEVELRGHQAAVTVALGAPSSTVTPTEADKYRAITVSTPAMFVEGETLYVKSVLISGVPLQLRVDTKNSDGTITVMALNTPTDYVPAIPEDTVIYRGAPSAGELKAQAQSVVHYPDMRFNYCQRFMAQIEQSITRGKVPSNSGWDFSDQQYAKMYDFRTSMEKQHVFGTKSRKFSAKDNEWFYTAEGIYWQLEQNLDYTTASGIDNNRWIDWSKELFSDNAGSQDRLLVGGNNLIAEILKIDLVQKQLNEKSVEIVPGLVINVVETSFGKIMVYHHKGFDLMGHSDDGMIIDMGNIKKRVFNPMQVTELELKKSGQRNVKARLIEEECCLETRYLGTHARIRKTA